MKVEDNITDEQYKEAFEDLYGYQEEESKKLLQAFKYVLQNINYPSERIKEYLRDGNNFHVGFCSVVKSDYKSSWYPNHDFYKIVGDIEGSDRTINVYFMRQDDNDDDSFHSLVYQICEYEDSYSGYLLFPLKDGRYWITSFSC